MSSIRYKLSPEALQGIETAKGKIITRPASKTSLWTAWFEDKPDHWAFGDSEEEAIAQLQAEFRQAQENAKQ